MNKKEKAWFIAVAVSLFLAIFYFIGVLIWLFAPKQEEESVEDFPPIQIILDEKAEVENIEVESVELLEQEQKKLLGVFTLTAYCSCEKCCGVWAHNRPVDDMGNEIVVGASGYRLASNVSVAVDPAVIPYGTELEIDGKTYIAHDCGGAIKGNRIDMYFDNHQEALNFGVQTKMVYMGGVAA